AGQNPGGAVLGIAPAAADPQHSRRHPVGGRPGRAGRFRHAAGDPGFTVPRLLQTFSSVPAAYHGRLTQELLRCAELIQSHWLFMAVLAAGSGGLILWSLSNASGPLRRKLDRHAVWRIYRYIQALRLLSL